MSAFWAGFEKQAADERSGKTLAGVGAGAAGAVGGYGAYRAATAHYTKPLDGLHKILHEASVRHAMGLGEPRHLGKRVALGAAGAALAGGAAYAGARHLQKKPEAEKTATKQARLDRLMGALKKRKLPVKDVHAALRSNDLKNQFRGINPHPETSLIKATEHAAETQATGGFSGPWEKARAKGGHE